MGQPKAWQDAVSPAEGAGTAAETGERANLVPAATKLAESHFAFASAMLDRQHEFAMCRLPVRWGHVVASNMGPLCVHVDRLV